MLAIVRWAQARGKISIQIVIQTKEISFHFFVIVVVIFTLVHKNNPQIFHPGIRGTKTEYSRSIGKNSFETQAITQWGIFEIHGALNAERIRPLTLGVKMT